MAFVTVDNPSGILHHGAQMGWCPVSDSRVVMATVTTDYKVLVHEINFANGNANIGLATFVKTIPGTLTDRISFRPKVFSVGTDVIMVMAPASFATPARALYGNYKVGQSTAHIGSVPTTYDAIIMTRNGDGTYTPVSTASLNFASITSTAGYQSYPGVSIEMISASPTQIVLWRPTPVINVGNENFAAAQLLEYVITLENNIIQSAVGTFRQALSGATISRNTSHYDYRWKKLPDKSKVLLASTGQVYASSFADTPNGSNYKRLVYDVLGAAPPVVANSTVGFYPTQMSYISPTGFAPIDAAGTKHFMIGGEGAGANTATNVSTQQSSNAIFYNPLDTAWVAPSTLMIAGCPVGQGPQTEAYQRLYGPFFDHDVCASNSLPNNLLAQPLFLSFREINFGQYTGIYDPIATPYFYHPAMMCDNVIHRIDDTHCALIGVFKADVNAAPKIGVITVNV